MEAYGGRVEYEAVHITARCDSKVSWRRETQGAGDKVARGRRMGATGDVEHGKGVYRARTQATARVWGGIECGQRAGRGLGRVCSAAGGAAQAVVGGEVGRDARGEATSGLLGKERSQI
jgi:hypothetical protein